MEQNTMYLKYGLIGLITGFILGIFTMKLKNSNFCQKKISQKNIFKNDEYQKELNNFFNQNIHLLDIIANNYQTLYQHVLKNSNIFTTNKNINKITTSFKHDIYRYDNITNTNQFLTNVPRDYPENKDTHN